MLDSEIHALVELKTNLDHYQLQSALNLIRNCEGKVFITGSGTSSSVARRMAHTFTCSGVPSVYLDAGQCQHGYSAILSKSDLLIGISRGGETDEVNFLCKLAKNKGIKIISILENTQSTLGRLSDVILIGAVKSENEPLKTIPLSSTLIQEALGDILCHAINREKGFGMEEFGVYHPGGAVGKALNK